MNRFGERLHNEELFNGSARYVFHAAAGVNIGQYKRSGRLSVVGRVGGERLAFARYKRPRLLNPVIFRRFVFRERVDRIFDPVSVEQYEPILLRRHEFRFGERPRIRMGIPFRDIGRGGEIVGPELRIDNGDAAVMLAHAVAGRDRRDDLIAPGNRLYADKEHIFELISEQDRLPRSVRIHRPEMMIRNLFAVDVLPARIRQLAVVQNPRLVVLLHVRRQHADILPVRPATVNRRDVRQPALNVPHAARRTERDIAVGKIARFHVVVRARRYLA